jgi:amidase
MNARKLLKPCVILIGLSVAAAGVRAETHRLIPAVFYSTFSSEYTPVLRIKSGDRVVTATVDDLGAGADGKILAKGPNPQTGPFYVEGAEPGDLLLVTIEKLEPNRTTGQSTSLIAPDSLDVVGGMTGKPDPARFLWTIDKTKRTVSLDLQKAIPNVDWSTRFTKSTYDMPLRPALGSIGVAPEGKDTPSTIAPGPFGGNMVSSEITAGTKVMLRVYQTGALLFLGHGLAYQGDGDVTGTGVETSMDVEFSVNVVKKKEWPHSSVVRASTVVGEFDQFWPRLETADYIMTVGSAPTLQGALQHATTELHHWVDDDFGLSEKSVSILFGQGLEYKIASAVAPNFTVVAKLRKAYLPPPVPEK